MPQASLNVHNKEHKEHQNDAGRNNGSYLAGIIFFLIVLCTIIWSMWMVLNWMKNVNRFPISKLVITGERHYTRDDNIRKAILTLGMPGTFMTININAIQNQIKTMPWIRKVMVRKQWPDELKIHLVEYKPYAKWNDTFFINAEGTVFSLPALLNVKSNFLNLYGPQGSQQEILEMYRAIQQQLASYNFSIKSVSMSTRRAWQLVLTNDIRLNIGKQDIKKRLNRFVEIYPLLKQITDKRIGYIDLRYGSGAAVGWLPLLDKSITH
ncbi:MAG: cell division protein FtsQ [Arsenophonus sp. NC-WZS1-MAG3]